MSGAALPRRAARCGFAAVVLLLAWLALACDPTPVPPAAGMEKAPPSVVPPPAAPGIGGGAWRALARDTVRAGDTIERLLGRLELPRELLPDFVAAYDEVHDHRWIRPGEPVALLVDSLAGTLAFAHWPDPIRRILVRLPLAEVDGGRLPIELPTRAAVETLAPGRSRRIFAGEVQSSLYEAVLGAGGSPALVLAFSDICQWDVDFLLDVRRGDRFWLLVEEETYRGGWLDEPVQRDGRILAAAWIGAMDTVRASWFEGCGTSGWFDGAGQSFQKQFLKSPLNYRRISSRFGSRRHPVTRMISNHPGVDFAAQAGTPVVAPADGVIVEAGKAPFYGNKIAIRHSGRFKTVYGHLQGFARGIRKGAQVKQNQLIGYVGSTGRATGPHLHYEFIENGRTIDPLRMRNQATEPVPDGCLAAHLRLFRMRFGELERLGPPLEPPLEP